MSEALVTAIELLATELMSERRALREFVAASEGKNHVSSDIIEAQESDIKRLTRENETLKYRVAELTAALETARREISIHEQEYQKLLTKVGQQ